MEDPGFSVSIGKNLYGFKIKFANDYTFSLVFGDITESDDVKITSNSLKTEYFSKNAEVAVISPEGTIIPFNVGDKVKTKTLPENLPQIISWTMNR